jgi:ABC-type glycerol-3-phosphate transport system permease component
MAKRPQPKAKGRRAPKVEEVSDFQADASSASKTSLESGIIMATTFILVIGIVVGQMCLSKYFGAGLFG